MLGFKDDLVRIARQPEKNAARRHDVIVIGGGIYGVALAFEAGRHGYDALLLERDDFGGGTSWSSLRILHGGLRYLQTLDLRRFRESVAERRWFLRHFPDLVRPLPCLMPLYEHGLKRPSLMRVALACNDLLSMDRNWGLEGGAKLGRGGVLSARETARIFPQVDRRGLAGGAFWCDAVMLSSERLLIELLGWACRCGATALNYLEAERPIVDGDGIAGLEARDRVTGRAHQFQASRVINATGSWSRLVARRMDRDIAPLFRPTLAFNLLINRPPIADVAVAYIRLTRMLGFSSSCPGRAASSRVRVIPDSQKPRPSRRSLRSKSAGFWVNSTRQCRASIWFPKMWCTFTPGFSRAAAPARRTWRVER